jgi:glycine cleavage system pyridoxal-binding protein P
MSYNIHEGKRRKIFLDENVFIPTQSVIQTKAKFLDIDVIVGKYADFFQNNKPE